MLCMKPKTEEFLYLLLWSAEQLGRPTFRDLTDSYEAWAYRRGLLRQAVRMERARLIESTPQENDRLYRLTEAGRLHALGGRDPVVQWNRRWDGRWRLVLFDVPEERHSERNKLRRFLSERFFGLLQRSVWISPDSMDEIDKRFQGAEVNVNSLILFEAKPSGNETDAQIVAGAWPFDKINQGYRDHLVLLEQIPGTRLGSAEAAKNLQKWASAERSSWMNVISKDPLLPKALLPQDYLGQKVWRERVEVLGKAGTQLRSFRL